MEKILKKAWHLPWKMNDAPHALLDILRGCNIRCEACYNNETPRFKSFEEIKSDYEKILSLRKISAIAIIGGEPLLHPELIKIIEFLKGENLKVELFTNGLLLDEEYCKKLAIAGVDLIFMHIDTGQNRPDLKDKNSFEEVNELKTQKAKMIKEWGMEAAISMTLTKSHLSELMDNVNFFINSYYVNYFLITLYRDIQGLGKLRGELPEAISGETKTGNISEEVEMREVVEILGGEGFIPYCYLTGKIDTKTPRWMSFVTAASFKNAQLKYKMPLAVSGFEKKYLKIYKEKHGVYPFFNPQNCIVNSAQILLNGIYGGGLLKKLGFLLKSYDKFKLIKRILVQSPANLYPDGTVDHCECCPDLTVHNGKIVPVCICDNFD